MQYGLEGDDKRTAQRNEEALSVRTELEGGCFKRLFFFMQAPHLFPVEEL
jgi:hypothetical protein